MKIKISRRYVARNKFKLSVLISLFFIWLIGYNNYKSNVHESSEVDPVYDDGPKYTQERINFLNIFQPDSSRIISEVLEWNITLQIDWMNLLMPAQDDPTLVEIIRTKFLGAPSYIYPFSKELKYNRLPGGLRNETELLISLIPQVINKTNKFFEAGANDGFTTSITLYFERVFGWTGLLVEPTPGPFNSLWMSHRNAHSANLCISPKPYPLQTKFFINDAYDVASGIAHRNNPEEKKEGVKYLPVQCVPVYTMLLALNYTEIALFSLDIEGTEYDALKTIPFDKVKIQVLFIEIQQRLNPSGGFKEISTLLQSHGYVFVKKFGLNYIFLYKK